MQIDTAHLTIVNDSRMQDGHHEEWDEAYVASIIHAHVERNGINTVRHSEPQASCTHSRSFLASLMKACTASTASVVTASVCRYYA